jgi:hypothetical protein
MHGLIELLYVAKTPSSVSEYATNQAPYKEACSFRQLGNFQLFLKSLNWMNGLGFADSMTYEPE